MSQPAALSLSLVAPDLTLAQAHVLVLGVYSSAQGPLLAQAVLSQESAQGLEAILEDLGVTGARDQLHRLPGLEDTCADIVALIGMGPRQEDPQEHLDSLRYAAGSAIRQLAGYQEVLLGFEATTLAEVSAIAQGAALGAFADKQHKSKTADAVKEAVSKVGIISPLPADQASAALNYASIVGQAVGATRQLVNMPPSHLYPESFATLVSQAAQGIDHLQVDVFDQNWLAKEGFGGILGVGQGSSRPARLVLARYRPPQAQARLALVGKGITFDTGGISLKPAESMIPMKSDMTGAATVFNAVKAVAQLKLEVEVTAYLCLAENMPGGGSIRPEDVLTLRDGKTVEVINTDAEVRLVMADGLAYASEFEPDAIIDLATLTGAQMLALGTRYAAVMGQEHIRNQLLRAAKTSGELLWPMPLPDYLKEELASASADLKNIGNGRWAGMLIAGLFLQEFVAEKDGKKIPWAHIDIAGPSYNNGAPYGYTPKEASGMSLLTLVNFIENFSASRTAHEQAA